METRVGDTSKTRSSENSSYNSARPDEAGGQRIPNEMPTTGPKAKVKFVFVVVFFKVKKR